jgi:hypothetical protein
MQRQPVRRKAKSQVQMSATRMSLEFSKPRNQYITWLRGKEPGKHLQLGSEKDGTATLTERMMDKEQHKNSEETHNVCGQQNGYDRNRWKEERAKNQSR